jgi:hypothetical protein
MTEQNLRPLAALVSADIVGDSAKRVSESRALHDGSVCMSFDNTEYPDDKGRGRLLAGPEEPADCVTHVVDLALGHGGRDRL